MAAKKIKTIIKLNIKAGEARLSSPAAQAFDNQGGNN